MENNEQKCLACDDGEFVDVDGICRLKICECLNGSPAFGDSCYNNDAFFCSSCDPGYHLETFNNSMICSPNICTCNNGSHTSIEDCPEHNLEYCEECLPDFKLTDYESTNNTSSYRTCEKCASGEFLDDDQICKLKMCVCDMGVPTEGENCNNNGATHCSVCDPGYFLYETGDSVVCEPNICVCNNGEYAVGSDCPLNGFEFCVSCLADYRLIDYETSDSSAAGYSNFRKCEPCPDGYKKWKRKDNHFLL